jgi:hypothetical protein
MWCDPIVDEIHRVRDEMAAKLGDDLQAICEDIRKKGGVTADTCDSPTSQVGCG